MEGANVDSSSKAVVEGNKPGGDAEEKVRLEIQKLRAEIEGLKRDNSWWGRVDRNAALLAAVIAAASVGVGLYQFNSGQAANREQLRIQSDREETARGEELKKTYWEEQKKIYEQASNYAALICKADSTSRVASETKQFWALYWGNMSLLEHHEVERAMIDFGDALEKWQRTNKKPEGLENLSYTLAHCMRQSLSKTWRPVSGGSVRDDACPYQ
jgi:hypothetical protein